MTNIWEHFWVQRSLKDAMPDRAAKGNPFFFFFQLYAETQEAVLLMEETPSKLIIDNFMKYLNLL